MRKSNLFLSFNCKLNGEVSWGNTVLEGRGKPQNMNDIMQLEGEIKSVYENNFPKHVLTSVSIIGMELL